MQSNKIVKGKLTPQNSIYYVTIKCSHNYKRLITGHTAKVQMFSGILGSDNVINSKTIQICIVLLLGYIYIIIQRVKASLYIIQLQ